MVDRKRVKQIDATRKQILSTAIPLLTEKGFDTVSMETIARVANVSRATLYNHFDDKAAILDAAFAEAFATGAPDLLAQAMKIPLIRERLAFVFKAFAQWAAPKKALLSPVIAYGMRQSLDHAGQPDPLETFFGLLLARPGTTEPVLGQTPLAHYLRHLYLAATLRWLASSEPDPSPYFSEMLSLFLDGAEQARNAP